MNRYTNKAPGCRIAAMTLLAVGALTAGSLVGCAATTTKESFSPDTGTPPVSEAGSSPDAGTPESGSEDSSSGALALPFYVSNDFIPSGFMNDPTGITLSTGANGTTACPTRAPNAGGDCYVATWHSTGPEWAGVYWQYPANNWGTEPGMPIAPGATQITFYARGAEGGEQITFKSGGLNDPLSVAVGSYGDSFAVAAPLTTLTTSWSMYTVNLEGATYPAGVLGAFVWVAAAADGGNDKITFYVDDIQWQ